MIISKIAADGFVYECLWYWGAKIVITIVEFQFFMVHYMKMVRVKFLIEWAHIDEWVNDSS